MARQRKVQQLIWSQILPDLQIEGTTGRKNELTLEINMAVLNVRLLVKGEGDG